MQKIIAGVLSLYLAAFLYLEIPLVQTFIGTTKTGNDLFLAQLEVFTVFFIISLIILSRVLTSDSSELLDRPVKAVLVALAFFGVLGVIFSHIIPFAYMSSLPYNLSVLFASDNALTLWLALPLILLFF